MCLDVRIKYNNCKMTLSGDAKNLVYLSKPWRSEAQFALMDIKLDCLHVGIHEMPVVVLLLCLNVLMLLFLRLISLNQK